MQTDTVDSGSTEVKDELQNGLYWIHYGGVLFLADYKEFNKQFFIGAHRMYVAPSECEKWTKITIW